MRSIKKQKNPKGGSNMKEEHCMERGEDGKKKKVVRLLGWMIATKN